MGDVDEVSVADEVSDNVVTRPHVPKNAGDTVEYQSGGSSLI